MLHESKIEWTNLIEIIKILNIFTTFYYKAVNSSNWQHFQLPFQINTRERHQSLLLRKKTYRFDLLRMRKNTLRCDLAMTEVQKMFRGVLYLPTSGYYEKAYRYTDKHIYAIYMQSLRKNDWNLF